MGVPRTEGQGREKWNLVENTDLERVKGQRLIRKQKRSEREEYKGDCMSTRIRDSSQRPTIYLPKRVIQELKEKLRRLHRPRKRVGRRETQTLGGGGEARNKISTAIDGRPSRLQLD